MVYNDTTNKLGIIQKCETTLFGDDGYGQITGNANRLYQFAERINRAQDRLVFLLMTADGRWQYDDTNYTDYGIATTNIVSGQKDYTFNVSHLEIEKVLIYQGASVTSYKLIDPIDQNDPDATGYLENISTNVGLPIRYDKRANSIFLDPTPNYNSTAGLKIYFKRGPSYFLYSDTTTVPGFASIFHGFLAIHASAHYALDRTMKNAGNLFELLAKEEKAIKEFYSQRNNDEKPRMNPSFEDSHSGR